MPEFEGDEKKNIFTVKSVSIGGLVLAVPALWAMAVGAVNWHDTTYDKRYALRENVITVAQAIDRDLSIEKASLTASQNQKRLDVMSNDIDNISQKLDINELCGALRRRQTAIIDTRDKIMSLEAWPDFPGRAVQRQELQNRLEVYQDGKEVLMRNPQAVNCDM